MPAAGPEKLLHDVPFSIFPRAVLYGMLGVMTGPQTNPVVMFGRENQALHAGIFGRRGDLVGVEVGWIEDRFAFVAVAPFFICEGIHREVNEPIEFHLMPPELAWRGNRAEGP